VTVAAWSAVTAFAVAVKFAVVAAAPTVVLAGTVTAALLLRNETTAPPAGAAFVRVTLQLTAPAPLATDAGVHATEDTCTAVTRLRVAVLLTPFRAAVTIADWSVVTVPAAALNVPVVAPAAIDTEAGTVRELLFLVSATDEVAVAAFVSVTVQLAAAPLPMVRGAHDSADNCGAVLSVTDAVFVTPAAVAVIVTVWSAGTLAAVAEKLAVAAPAGTVTLAGTVMLVALVESATAAPPAGAGPLSDTLQDAAPGALRVAGEQVTLDNVVVTDVEPPIVIAPPDAVVAIPVPALVAAYVRLIWREVVGAVVADAIWNVRVATTPAAIVFVFNPYAMQVTLPVTVEHCTFLPAATAAAPGAAATPEISAAE
jgi:hypothetical protein